MLDAIDPIARPHVALMRLLVAALLGGLIGVERERAEGRGAREQFAGVRTFPLFALLGAVLALVSGQVGAAVVSGFAAVAALVVASYLRTSVEGAVGATTETAALLTYWVGVLAGGGALLLAGALGIGMAVLLASKARLEAFTRALTAEELTAALVLAVIAAVILPVLPDARYGPWGVWNPRHLWGMVVIVCALSFAAFVAMRVWGHARGLFVSGILGGLVSSTAATVSFASRSREEPAQAAALGVAAGLASLVMLVRVAILAALAGPEVLPHLGPFLLAALLGGGTAVAAAPRRTPTGPSAAPGVTNPFRLEQAIRFAVVYGLVQLAVAAASRYLGAWGVVAAAVVAGLTDVDAITLTLAGMAPSVLTPSAAGYAIALAVASNTLAKAVYASWLGGRAFHRTVLVVLGSALTVGLITLGAVWLFLGARGPAIPAALRGVFASFRVQLRVTLGE
ncbi:MAG: MgtC/SapB family protein [Armatimonadota bacterium]|nr:MgtC/SapB family protein [Armatimonadota bacterium]